MKKRIAAALCIIATVFSVSLFSGCGGSIRKIVISGDIEVVEIMEKLAYEYAKEADVIIDVNASGASLGFLDVVQGRSDIGLMARNLRGTEGMQVDSYEEPLCQEGMAIIVNKDFPLELLPSGFFVRNVGELFWKDSDTWFDAVGGGYTPLEGELKARAEPVLGALKLVPVNRIQISGLRESFDECADLRFGKNNEEGKPWPDYDGKNTVVASSEAEAVNSVVNNPGAVAFVRYRTYESNTNKVAAIPLRRTGVEDDRTKYEPTMMNITTGRYPFQRNFRYFTNSEGVNAETKAFLEWLKGPRAATIFMYDKLVINSPETEN